MKKICKLNIRIMDVKIYFSCFIKCIFCFFTLFTSNIHTFFQVTSITDLFKKYPHITYQKCSAQTDFSYKQHPFYMGDTYHPYKGIFEETFVLTIPHGRALSQYGFVLIDDHFIKEMIWKNLECHLQLVHNIQEQNVYKVSGRVAALGQLAYFQYYHWISEVLCRLAMLEINNIAYDKLYIPQNYSFMKETLELWGIKEEQIIQPYGIFHCIEADELILPSLVSNVNFGLKWFACYPRKDLMEYVKTKLLKGALLKNTYHQFCKKVFISRKDAPRKKIINEDEFFELFQQQGFQRYQLSNMSATDQILLFYNAEIVIGAQGTSLANCMFCKPKTKIIEIFQKLNDPTISYVAQIFDLNYIPIKTVDFDMNYNNAFTDTKISLDIINLINTNFEEV